MGGGGQQKHSYNEVPRDAEIEREMENILQETEITSKVVFYNSLLNKKHFY